MRTRLERYAALDFTSIPGKGRGVVATEAIAADTVLEVAPVIPLTRAEELALRGTVLESYVFLWEREEQASHPFALVMGTTSMLNHSRDANADWERDIAAQVTRLTSLRAIASGEEVTVDYQCDIWFEEAT